MNYSAGALRKLAKLKVMRAHIARKSLAVLIAAVVVGSNLTNYAQAAAGDLDPTFDFDGRVVTEIPGQGDSALDIAIQSDGKIVVAGFSNPVTALNDFEVARYNRDGSLDSSFDGDGIVVTDFSGGVDSALAIAIQSDDRIVVGGISGAFAETPGGALARYNSDGSLDASFGVGGRVTSSSSGFLIDLAIQSDGKIVAVGFVGADFAVARYNGDGSLDDSFDGDGQLTTDFGGAEQAFALVIQPDGKIVVAGFGSVDTGGILTINALLARYNADGSLDTSFDGDGKVRTDLSGGALRINALALQSDGKLVAAGSAGSGQDTDFALARYNTNGSLDTSFDGDGVVITDFSGEFDIVRDIAIQNNGRIVVAGRSVSDFALARYNSDGSLDISFGGDGLVTTDFGDEAFGVAIQVDGHIVVTGRTSVAGSIDFALARYEGDPLTPPPCPNPAGFWKNNLDAWPVGSLTLGTQSYTQAELLTLLDTPNRGDASLILAKQLIAARLSIANGSDPTPINSTVTNADTLLGGFAGKLPYNVKGNSPAKPPLLDTAAALESYNNGLATPGCAP
jgi:uncharacterized delta-60 repeat protein